MSYILDLIESTYDTLSEIDIVITIYFNLGKDSRMYRGQQQAFNAYQQFKEDIFNKKKQEFKDRAHANNSKPSSPKPKYFSNILKHSFTKKFTKVALAGAIVFLLAKYNCVDKYFMPMIQNQAGRLYFHAFSALRNDLIQKVKNNSGKNLQEYRHFATSELTRRVQEDLKATTLKLPSRILRKQQSSSWGIGPFRFRTSQESTNIDDSGYVVRINKQSKFKVGDLSVFGRKKLQVIDKPIIIKGYEKYGTLEKQQINQKIGTVCRVANGFNKIALESGDYENSIQNCERNLERAYMGIHKERQRVQKKYQKFANGQSRIFIFS